MSGYQYSSDHPNYYPTPTYPVPQYTQAQINAYYTQYGCYPQQPYEVVTESFYAQSGGIAPSSYAHAPTTAPAYAPYAGGHSLTVQEQPRSRSPRTWKCELPNCSSTANFTRLADLQRHQSTVHGVGTPGYPCTVQDCTRVGEKGFTRRDHLVEHLRNFHHIDIPKRRPGERSAYPFGLGDYQ
ncbi:hypothetical protein K458DRAFT_419328 [Lentithecium fluviatile CBS 122367]|uniref:C2H2-type domain-containing protein n=1 Tax=Lentithecium fluviatile CBS 122367 TaxID=1168545 RepID=A0A6G1IYR9_9PLEO|nr:hypothetical protein K458DRAFT_419328 [Lentithecium fluviatile CBS 122367]